MNIKRNSIADFKRQKAFENRKTSVLKAIGDCLGFCIVCGVLILLCVM